MAGNIPFELLFSYADQCPSRTLENVIDGLDRDRITDINFGARLRANLLTDHQKEASLDWEEIRINRDAKRHHTVYNKMNFPDRLDRPVSTITATCTRISRESIIVEDGDDNFRRLTIRERATLQGFPLTYQIYGGSHSEKLRLIGNALPPPLSYYVGLAIRGVTTGRMVPLYKRKNRLPKSRRPICVTNTDSPGRKYPPPRRFRFAISGLRFKSGTRFDLTNEKRLPRLSWGMEFIFGPSTDFRQIKLGLRLEARLKKDKELRSYFEAARPVLRDLDAYLQALDFYEIQQHWVKKIRGAANPFICD